MLDTSMHVLCVTAVTCSHTKRPHSLTHNTHHVARFIASFAFALLALAHPMSEYMVMAPDGFLPSTSSCLGRAFRRPAQRRRRQSKFSDCRRMSLNNPHSRLSAVDLGNKPAACVAQCRLRKGQASVQEPPTAAARAQAIQAIDSLIGG